MTQRQPHLLVNIAHLRRFLELGSRDQKPDTPSLYRVDQGRGYQFHWRRQAWLVYKAWDACQIPTGQGQRCWRRRRPETANEKANRVSDRAKMSGVQRHWIGRGGTASAARPQNLSSTLQEMRWQGADKRGQLRALKALLR
jgi:hypothetical protein